MSLITEREVRALAIGATLAEKIGGRGEGALQLVRRARSVRVYYRYTDGTGRRVRVALGALTEVFSLRAARAKCRELAALQAAHPDLKAWLAVQAAQERAELQAATRRAEMAARQGSLRDLLNDYTASLAARGRASSAYVQKVFEKEVFTAAPGIAALAAREVGPDEIVDLLRPLSARGAKVYRNRMRAYLHAAYAYGLRAEYDETRQSTKRFGLTQNPVAAVPLLDAVERVGERALSAAELRQFYRHVGDVTNVGPVMAVFIQFLIATGGQRPKQVLAARWEDYDLEARTLRIIDRKGRGAKARVHLVPLSDRAHALLAQVQPVTGRHPWPFTAHGRGPLSIESLKNVIKRFRASENGRLDGVAIPHFCARDLRRTAKQLMVRAEIPRDLRNLLQNHGQTGVDVTAYANDPDAHLPEKRRAMVAYEAALAAALVVAPAPDDAPASDPPQPSNVIRGRFGRHAPVISPAAGRHSRK